MAMRALSIGLSFMVLLALEAHHAMAQSAPESTGPAAEKPAAASPAPASAGAPGLNAREQQVLERIRQLKAPRWRTYGVCRYDWSTWRLTDGAVRTTEVECGPDSTRAVVAVHCDTLQVSRREGDAAWSPWRLPLSPPESKSMGGEDLMVAALCANIQKTAEGATAPAPPKNPPGSGSSSSATTKPATTKPVGSKPAVKSTAKPAAQPTTKR